MKTTHPALFARCSNERGFSLPEMLIAGTLFTLLLGGIVTANLFGMRMFQITGNQLQTEDGARKALGFMADDIRQCKNLWLGNVTNGTFVAVLDGETQAGNAALLQPSSNPTNLVVYFLDSSDQSFRRMFTSGSASTVLANAVTNTIIFGARDFSGNLLTNSQNNRVIHARLDFFQDQRWLPQPNHFQLETAVARRVSN
jgi:hypothetical protein